MKPMLAVAPGGGFLGAIAAFALGTLALSLLVPMLARIKKTRVLALCGSALLIGFGSLGLWIFCEDWGGWPLLILFGIIPILSGCIGLFRLSRSSKNEQGKH
jgi:cyanate permease